MVLYVLLGYSGTHSHPGVSRLGDYTAVSVFRESFRRVSSAPARDGFHPQIWSNVSLSQIEPYAP